MWSLCPTQNSSLMSPPRVILIPLLCTPVTHLHLSPVHMESLFSPPDLFTSLHLMAYVNSYPPPGYFYRSNTGNQEVEGLGSKVGSLHALRFGAGQITELPWASESSSIKEGHENYITHRVTLKYSIRWSMWKAEHLASPRRWAQYIPPMIIALLLLSPPLVALFYFYDVVQHIQISKYPGTRSSKFRRPLVNCCTQFLLCQLESKL